jgi:hypothetical protein
VTGSAAGAVRANKRGSDNSTDRLRGRLRAASLGRTCCAAAAPAGPMRAVFPRQFRLRAPLS